MPTFYLINSIDHYTLFAFSYFLMEIQSNPPQQKEIRIYINSQGGDSGHSERIISALESLKKEGYTIHTFATGLCASMALHVFLAGDNGYRTTSLGTNFLFHRSLKKYKFDFELKEHHDVNKLLRVDEITKMHQFIKTSNTKIIDQLVKKTKLTKKLFLEWEEKFFNPIQAKKWGMVDHITPLMFDKEEIEKSVKKLINPENKIPSVFTKEIYNQIEWCRMNFQNSAISENEAENILKDIFFNQSLQYVLGNRNFKFKDS